MDTINNNKITEKKLLKKNAILTAASQVFSEKGYINTSIKNITDQAGISVGSFYSYFSSKEEVLAQIYDEVLQMSFQTSANISSSGSSIEENFTKAMACAVWTYVKRKEYSKVILSKSTGITQILENKRQEIIQRTKEYIQNVLVHLNEHHAIEIYNIEITAVLITHSVLGVISYYINEEKPCKLGDMIFNLCTYHLNALKINFSNDDIHKYINSVLLSQYETYL